MSAVSSHSTYSSEHRARHLLYCMVPRSRRWLVETKIKLKCCHQFWPSSLTFHLLLSDNAMSISLTCEEQVYGSRDPPYFFKYNEHDGEMTKCVDLYRLRGIAADNFFHVPGRISLSGTRAGSWIELPPYWGFIYPPYKFFASFSLSRFCCFFKATKNEDKMKTPVPGAGFASSRKPRHTPEPMAGGV
jgi:hypothetical protein